jgi:hypothetical protein
VAEDPQWGRSSQSSKRYDRERRPQTAATSLVSCGTEPKKLLGQHSNQMPGSVLLSQSFSGSINTSLVFIPESSRTREGGSAGHESRGQRSSDICVAACSAPPEQCNPSETDALQISLSRRFSPRSFRPTLRRSLYLSARRPTLTTHGRPSVLSGPKTKSGQQKPVPAQR